MDIFSSPYNLFFNKNNTKKKTARMCMNCVSVDLLYSPSAPVAFTTSILFVEEEKRIMLHECKFNLLENFKSYYSKYDYLHFKRNVLVAK